MTTRFACALALSVLSVLSVGGRGGQEKSAAFDQTHAVWTEVLKAHVRDAGFDYAKLKQDHKALDAYLAALRAVTPQELAGWTEKQRFAFWINTYNAYCVQKVIENYPLKSIRKLDGVFGVNTVFDKEFIPMKAHKPGGGDDELSLNDIEHRILRAKFRDARLHAAINCASKSCPPLRAEAFTAEKLDGQLDEQMRAFVNDPARNHLDGKELELSEIFKWFEEDFERDAKSVGQFVARFAPADKADAVRAAKIRYLDYDWDLNDVAR